MLDFSVNVWAVLVAAFASMMIGVLWYGPVFGKEWMRFAGLSKKDMQRMPLSATTAMILGSLVALLTAYILAVLIGSLSVSVIGAIVVSLVVYAGIAMPIHLGVFMWEGRPFGLFLVNTVQYLLSIVVMSIILGLWI